MPPATVSSEPLLVLCRVVDGQLAAPPPPRRKSPTSITTRFCAGHLAEAHCGHPNLSGQTHRDRVGVVRCDPLLPLRRGRPRHPSSLLTPFVPFRLPSLNHPECTEYLQAG